MKRLVFASAAIVAGFCTHAAYAAAPGECFANPSAVFSAHPNATHASYIVRRKGSEDSRRCWYADAFKAQAQADAKPIRRSAAAIAKTSEAKTSEVKTSEAKTSGTRTSEAKASASHHASKAPAQQLRRAATASASHRPTTTAMAPAWHPRAAAVASMSLEFPAQVPTAVQIAVNASELSRLLPVDDDTPTDFNTRFSASGYTVPR